jgi:hypothetical protein
VCSVQTTVFCQSFLLSIPVPYPYVDFLRVCLSYAGTRCWTLLLESFGKQEDEHICGYNRTYYLCVYRLYPSTASNAYCCSSSFINISIQTVRPTTSTYSTPFTSLKLVAVRLIIQWASKHWNMNIFHNTNNVIWDYYGKSNKKFLYIEFSAICIHHMEQCCGLEDFKMEHFWQVSDERVCRYRIRHCAADPTSQDFHRTTLSSG